MREQRIPGVAVALVRDGGIVAEQGFGYRRIDTQQPMTPHTCLPIASLTKSFTATCVMSLVERGKLHLDDPVVSYLPWFRVADPAATRQITPRVLLSHR